MLHPPLFSGLLLFAALVCGVIALAFFLRSKARTAAGFFAAGGQVPALVNGVALAGGYLSAASFLGVVGCVAFYGYDGFLYSLGLLAGWVVLLLIAEPLRRRGRFTFADALDAPFHSRGVRLAAAISTLAVSLLFLIPQMVCAGALAELLGFSFAAGVIGAGAIVILIVAIAGMVSTTWVQFVQGLLLVAVCLGVTIALFSRGLSAKPAEAFPRIVDGTSFAGMIAPDDRVLPENGAWAGKHFVRVRHADGSITTWKYAGMERFMRGDPASVLTECQVLAVTSSGERLVDGKPQGAGNELHPAGFIANLPMDMAAPTVPRRATGPLNPKTFLAAIENSTLALPQSETIADADGTVDNVYYPLPTPGEDVMAPGLHPTLFAGMQDSTQGRLNFVSLMLALFGGVAGLPHVLMRFFTVKNAAAVRNSTVLAIGVLGLLCALMLFVGLWALGSGQLDPANAALSAPLLGKAFGNGAFAAFAVVAFMTVLASVSGVLMAASGALAHDLPAALKWNLDDMARVRAGRIAAATVGVLAILLGLAFRKVDLLLLVGWTFNVAASANLPAITLGLFWKRATKQGIAASILAGLLSSLAWILLSAAHAPLPFEHPALVTVPLAYFTLIAVSLITQPPPAEVTPPAP